MGERQGSLCGAGWKADWGHRPISLEPHTAKVLPTGQPRPGRHLKDLFSSLRSPSPCTRTTWLLHRARQAPLRGAGDTEAIKPQGLTSQWEDKDQQTQVSLIWHRHTDPNALKPTELYSLKGSVF